MRKGQGMMQIHGLQKMTLLDYPGKIACTVFLGHCNFRCPFCQNGGLVLHPEQEPLIEEKELLGFLRKRQGLLDAVCISGGEPTLEKDLPSFLRQIRDLGYLIKLDTNGSAPEMLLQLAEEGLLDYVAMDIKNAPGRYGETAGTGNTIPAGIMDSVDFLKRGTLDYEFRTTVVKEFHTDREIREIGRWLSGSKRYFLQNYRDSAAVLQPGLHSCTEEQLLRWKEILSEEIAEVGIRM